MQRILVIKLGALGDFVQAFGPFAAIRAHHPQAQVTLLTTAPYAELARQSPWFDDVHVDTKPKLWNIGRLLDLRRFLQAGFDRVYDLQTSDRSGWYFRLTPVGTQWSGIAKGCSHPHANPQRDSMHTLARQQEQLTMAGISNFPAVDLAWTDQDIRKFGLSGPFALLCPGGAPHRPAKRWPAQHYAALAVALTRRGVRPVLIGTHSEQDERTIIRTACPDAVDLGGQTSFSDLLALGRQSVLAVGNDTGPMHLIAASQCPSVVLFSRESDPALCAPHGHVQVLRVDNLAELSPERVEHAACALT